MADPFVAEIRIMTTNFAPRGWAFCNGQILPLSQNTALFALLGTTYGGNGKSNFALPDLTGRAPMMHGQGPGLSLRDLGENGGSDQVTLIESEIPNHTHSSPQAINSAGTTKSPQGPNSGNYIGGRGLNVFKVPNGNDEVLMAGTSLAIVGGSTAHNNMQPYLTLNFCIALQGVFPPRA